MREGPMARVPGATIEWLTSPENPAVAHLTRTVLLGEGDTAQTARWWAARNDYPPVAAILGAMRPDGSWDTPGRDYQKYRGSLWQIHILGELYANGADDRVRRALAYARSRQLDDGSWSASNMRPAGSIPCLTANVGRALARMGGADDPHVRRALEYLVDLYRDLGVVECRQSAGYHLNGYCHMLTPKVLLFLSEVPGDLWPEGAEELRDACVAALRDKQVFRCLAEGSREFEEAMYTMPAAEREGYRERYLKDQPAPQSFPKPGWLRFGYPLSYNSDILESLGALMLTGETPRPEYAEAIQVVRDSADGDSRWKLRNSFNGRMFGDVEVKGEPSRWITYRALRVLSWADA